MNSKHYFLNADLADEADFPDFFLDLSATIRPIRPIRVQSVFWHLTFLEFPNNFLEMAAADAFHIAENQPFLDGDKRTALVACLVFLDINGFEILDTKMRLYAAMIAIANKEMDKYDLADLLKELAGK